MKSIEHVKGILEQRIRDKETGLSLVETLVAIALFAVIAVMAVSIIVTTLDSTARFSEVSTTQAKVMQAAATIQRDVSIANSIKVATASQITFTTRQANLDYEVTVFHYGGPGVTTTLPTGVDESKLPNYSAIIQLRKQVTTGTISQSILVSGYDPSAYPKAEGATSNLFRYFNTDNNTITAASTQKERDKIVRVEFRIAAKAAGRGTYIQIESSATPAYSLPPGVTANNIGTLPECPANLDPQIVATETEATIRWNAPAGATSYTLYRYNVSAGKVLEQSWVIPDPGTVVFKDSGLQWGRTYQYAIQSNGPAGSSAPCGFANATVVPQQIEFKNINSLQQSLTATKANSAAENLSAPTVQNVTTPAKATTNILQGARYTVARNLINQLSWNETFGTTGFNIYLNGETTPIATVASGKTYWQDTDLNFGAVKSYTIRPFNDGGESFAANSVTLISPPTLSKVTAARPDTSTRATTTDNTMSVTLANQAPNTTGYKAYRVTTTAATANCDFAGAMPALNFPALKTGTSSKGDNSVEWGSYTCYKYIPFNDAGDGAVSEDVIVKQFPGKFTIAQASSSEYKNINTGVPLPAGTQCWVSNIGTTDAPCNVYAAMTTNNRLALGLFGQVQNTKTNLNVSWNQSTNAYGGYSIAKTRTQTGGVYQDQGSVSSTNQANYTTGAQSTRFLNEMPGSAYDFRVTAKAANGESRTSGVASTVSSPDIPRSMDINFQTRSSVSYAAYMRIKVSVNTGVFRGLATSTVINADSAWGRNSVVVPGASGVQTTYSPEYNYGYHGEGTYTVLNLKGVTSYSTQIGRAGETTAGCSNPCGADYGDIPEAYPNYYAGGHYRYNAGGDPAPSVDGGPGNTGTVTPPVEPSGPPTDGSGIPDGATYDCSVLSEDDPLFVDEYGCAYGKGIPRAPTNLKIDSVDESLVNLSWNSVPYVTGYEVTVTTGSVVNKYTTSTNAYAATIPPGGTSTVSVKAVNSAATSSPSNVLTIKLPGIPQNLRLSSLSGTTANVAWNAATNATSYRVSLTVNGTTTNYTTSTTSYAVTLPASSAGASIVVRGVNATGTSAVSNTLLINAPAVPTNFRLVSQSGTTANVAWNAAANATSYKINLLIDGVATSITTTGTTYAITVPFGSSATATVQAVNSSGASAVSNSISINTAVPVPAAPTLSFNDDAGVTPVTPNTIAWTQVTCTAGTAEYLLSRTAPTAATIVNWSTTNSVAQTLVADTTYGYSVVARCNNGSSSSANSAAGTLSFVARNNAPATPSIAPAVDKTTAYLPNSPITFTFPASGCPTGSTPTYNLYMNGALVASSNTNTLTTTTDTVVGTDSYTYKVTCTSNGYTTPESAASPAKIVTVVSAPAAPNNFTVTRIFGTNVYFSWSSVPGANKYVINFNGKDTIVNSTATGTLTATIVGKTRNQTFVAGPASAQAAPEALPVATITSYETNGYSSDTSPSIAVGMAQTRIFSNVYSGFLPQAGITAANMDTRNGNSVVSADGLRATVLQADRNLVTYNLSTMAPLWAASTYSMQRIGHWILDTSGAHAWYEPKAGGGWTLIWCEWGCGGTTMIVQENANVGSPTGRFTGYAWNGTGWTWKGAYA